MDRLAEEKGITSGELLKKTVSSPITHTHTCTHTRTHTPTPDMADGETVPEVPGARVHLPDLAGPALPLLLPCLGEPPHNGSPRDPALPLPHCQQH